jgi:hypothetical protein
MRLKVYELAGLQEIHRLDRREGCRWAITKGLKGHARRGGVLEGSEGEKKDLVADLARDGEERASLLRVVALDQWCDRRSLRIRTLDWPQTWYTHGGSSEPMNESPCVVEGKFKKDHCWSWIARCRC